MVSPFHQGASSVFAPKWTGNEATKGGAFPFLRYLFAP